MIEAEVERESVVDTYRKISMYMSLRECRLQVSRVGATAAYSCKLGVVEMQDGGRSMSTLECHVIETDMTCSDSIAKQSLS
jgi:hypothetical protein